MEKIKHKIVLANRPNAEYYARYWLTLQDGGSDQWLYVSYDGAMRFYFIEIIDMPAYCGQDAQDYWCADVSVVDLLDADPRTIQQAIESCGYEGMLNDSVKPLDIAHRLAIAEVLWQYGARAPMYSESAGPVKQDRWGMIEELSAGRACFRGLRKRARDFAESLWDDEHCNEMLDTKVVNNIGQTARSYAKGTEGLWDQLREIKDMGDEATPEQKLVLKMYQKCEDTLGAGPIPKDIREGLDTPDPDDHP